MKKLSNKSLRTIESLERKISGKAKNCPTLKLVSELLTEIEIPHDFKYIKRTKSKRHPYNGNLIKEGTREYSGYYLQVGDLAIDTINTEYQKKSYKYARQLKEIVEQKLKENKI